MTLRRGNDRANPRGMVEARFLVPRGFWDTLTLYCALTGERRLEWLRRTLIDGLERGMAAFPVRFCWLRPGVTVFSHARGVFTPVAVAAGGERAWPIEVVPFPSALSPLKMGWRIDVTSDAGGFEGRDLFVPVEAVVGQKPPNTEAIGG